MHKTSWKWRITLKWIKIHVFWGHGSNLFDSAYCLVAGSFEHDSEWVLWKLENFLTS
jgi:hypothetical protein